MSSRGLFVGLTTLDLVHRVRNEVGRDEKVTALRQDLAAGGPAANAAVTFAALGGEATLVTCLGRHPLAVVAADELRNCGVRVLDATPDRTAPPAVSAVRVVEQTAERSVSSVNDTGGEPGPVEFPDADVVVLDGWHPALALGALSTTAPIIVGSGSQKPVLAELVPRATAVIVSNAAIAPGAARRAVTAGAGPIRWSDGAMTGEITPRKVTARDTLAAGDTFLGAAAFALARIGADRWAEILTFAADVAGVRVAHIGPRTWLDHLGDVSHPPA